MLFQSDQESSNIRPFRAYSSRCRSEALAVYFNALVDLLLQRLSMTVSYLKPCVEVGGARARGLGRLRPSNMNVTCYSQRTLLDRTGLICAGPPSLCISNERTSEECCIYTPASAPTLSMLLSLRAPFRRSQISHTRAFCAQTWSPPG